MRHALILGAGTAGTMLANRLRRALDHDQWRVIVVDRDDDHVYQPGLLEVVFGHREPGQLVRSRSAQIADGVSVVKGEIDRVDTDARTVHLADGRHLSYDQLVIATGTSPHPEETPGMDGALWRRSVHEFYTLEGARALRDALDGFRSGRLVVHVTEMPIKCPIAPLEFALMAESELREQGLRDAVEITYVTPLSGAFTRPIASARLGHLLEERGITVEPDFVVERVDEDASALVSYDERSVPFDLLVTVPLNKGADFLARSGLGDDLNYVPVDPQTFLARGHDDVWAIGDASDIPTSKAGSVAHFSVEIFVPNFLEHIAGRRMTHSFDGHANCFIESGHGKALLIDFNYDVEPLPGKYPVPGVGPMTLLDESRMNHFSKQSFSWIYWNVLLPGRPIPLPSAMSMAGKHATEATP